MQKSLKFVFCALFLVPLLAPAITLEGLRFAISDKYQNHYKNNDLKITNLKIEISKNLPLEKMELLEIDINKSTLNNSTGTAMAVLKMDNQKEYLLINFVMTATLKVLYAKTALKDGQPLNSINAGIKVVPLKSFIAPPAPLDALGQKSIKGYVNTNAIIGQNRLTSKRLVNKKEMIDVIYSVDGLEINYKMLSLDNGAIGDIIRVKNTSSNEIFKAEIIGSNRAKFLN